MYICDICKKKFHFKEECERHVREKHFKPNLGIMYICVRYSTRSRGELPKNIYLLPYYESIQ